MDIIVLLFGVAFGIFCTFVDFFLEHDENAGIDDVRLRKE